MPIPDLELGARLRAWRMHRGLSQADLERRAGLAHNALSRIEKGDVMPRLATLERVADALEISIEQIQFRSPPGGQPVAGAGATNGDTSALLNAIDSLPEERRAEVVGLLIQVVQQVRA